MRLLETDAKELLSKAGISVPTGKRVSTAAEAEAVAREIGEVVLKVLGKKGRGKAGMIKFANSPAEAFEAAKELLEKSDEGLIIEKKLDILEELYVAFAVDFSISKPVLIVSKKGGVEIENQADVKKIPINILRGLTAEQAGEAVAYLGHAELSPFLQLLYKQFRKIDSELLEINPLAITANGAYVADALIEINDDSLSRQPFRQETPTGGIEAEMAGAGWSYHDLGGSVGLICSGAGLSMATLDLIQIFGGKPANFLDMAQVDGDGIYRGLEILSKKQGVRSIIISLFAGLNRCDSMAEGITRFVREKGQKVPIIVRMVGNREEEGFAILRSIGLEPYKELEAAVKKAVEVAV
ncbi:MAG: ADP-forming succinate--CoA ligase subunit beta [Candidatus Aenigmarchaeota archaeon]|nr:ADP-forming succinate--CoA ligase subunit beta [Candidatus Aenigmarchaeota archaeon]